MKYCQTLGNVHANTGATLANHVGVSIKSDGGLAQAR